MSRDPVWWSLVEFGGVWWKVRLGGFEGRFGGRLHFLTVWNQRYTNDLIRLE